VNCQILMVQKLKNASHIYFNWLMVLVINSQSSMVQDGTKQDLSSRLGSDVQDVFSNGITELETAGVNARMDLMAWVVDHKKPSETVLILQLPKLKQSCKIKLN